MVPCDMSLSHKAALNVAAAGFISESKEKGRNGSQSLSTTLLRRGPLITFAVSTGWR